MPPTAHRMARRLNCGRRISQPDRQRTEMPMPTEQDGEFAAVVRRVGHAYERAAGWTARRRALAGLPG
jgi:hypothetical protein